jgi:hypothetical protein
VSGLAESVEEQVIGRDFQLSCSGSTRLDPGIHSSIESSGRRVAAVDCRFKPGNDDLG